jgi:hypothetical protein
VANTSQVMPETPIGATVPFQTPGTTAGQWAPPTAPITNGRGAAASGGDLNARLQELLRQQKEIADKLSADPDRSHLYAGPLSQINSDINQILGLMGRAPGAEETARVRGAEAATAEEQQRQRERNAERYGYGVTDTEWAVAGIRLREIEMQATKDLAEGKINFEKYQLTVTQGENELNRQIQRLGLALQEQGMVLTARGQDIAFDSAMYGNDAGLIAQALQAETQQRGQSQSYEMTRRGQDIQGAAAYGQTQGSLANSLLDRLVSREQVEGADTQPFSGHFRPPALGKLPIDPMQVAARATQEERGHLAGYSVPNPGSNAPTAGSLLDLAASMKPQPAPYQPPGLIPTQGSGGFTTPSPSGLDPAMAEDEGVPSDEEIMLLMEEGGL